MKRRAFLQSLFRCAGLSSVLGIVAKTSLEALAPGLPPRPRGKTLLDIHVHLFGKGDGGTGCFLSEEQQRHFNYRFFLELLAIDPAKGDMDGQYLRRLLRDARASTLDRFLLLAQDGRYDHRGKFDKANTHFYVPNDYLFEICRRHPDLFSPCVSINPKRRDALSEIDRCAEKGAKACKVHPPTQDVDLRDPAFRPFYRRLRERGLVLMVHTGTEHASKVPDQGLGDPARLEPALQEGCTVIAAHSGLGSFFDTEDFFQNLRRLVRRYPRLYCGTGNLGGMLRWRNLPRLLQAPEILPRLLHGSDYPFPPNPLVQWSRLSPPLLTSLLEEENLLDRAWAIEKALGMPDPVFGDRAARILGLA
ncbi:MAG TPA: hypothetical protein ENK02_05635 [Planctomycetes bacterium]|nr:hypothetical protein [Planctomycetota bacterium]